MKKNFKRLLCLVLVAALACSMCVMASAASSDYTDAADIKYTEAVEVLTGIGILEGTEDGSFGPNDNMTRAQAAKIIACLKLGTTNAEALVATSDPFDDVSTSHWAAGYIAYCASAGIVNGDGTGSFNPDANVTAYEFAKMLLVTVGYGQNGEYTGESWAVTAAADASMLGIFDGKSGAISGFTALTRDEMALYAFNALTGIAQVNYNSTLAAYYVGTSVLNNTDDDVDPKDTDSDYKYTIAYQLYDLSQTANGTDDFGRTVYSWKQGKVIICEDAYVTPDLSYTGKVTLGTLYSDLGSSTVNSYDGDFEYYVDGVPDATIAQPTKSSTTSAAKAGSTTEVYIEDNYIKIIIINNYAGQVTDVDDDEIDIDFYVDAKPDSATGLSYTGFEEDDYVVVTLTKGYSVDAITGDISLDGTYTVQSVAATETVTGTVTAYAEGSTTIDGTKYTRANKNTVDYDSYDLESSTYTFYLDENDCIVYSDVYEDSQTNLNYVYVSDSVANTYSALNGAATVKAAVTFMDGTDEVINLKVTNSTKDTAYFSLPNNTNATNTNTTISEGTDGKGTGVVDGEWADPIAVGFYSYTVNDSGYYTLKALKSAYAGEALSGTLVTDSDNSYVTINGSKQYVTSSTKLVLVDEGKSYTGYANFPSKTFNNSNSILYVRTSENGRLSYIYVVGDAVVDEELAYAMYKEYSYSTSDGVYLTFWVNGTTVDYLFDGDRADYNSLVKYTAGFINVDSDGYATFTTGTAYNTQAYKYTGTVKTVYTDAIEVTDATDSTIVYYFVLADDYESTRISTSGSVSGASAKEGDTVVVYTEDAVDNAYVGEAVAVIAQAN